MNGTYLGFVFGMLLASMLCFFCGNEYGRRAVQKEAVEAGVADWQTDASGHTFFQFHNSGFHLHIGKE